MNNFEKILKDLDTAEEESNVDLETINPKVRPAFEIQKRVAKDKIGDLFKKYSNEINQHAFVIFVKGDTQDAIKFAEIAEDEGETLTIDSQDLYKSLANEILPSMAHSKEVTSNQVAYLMTSLAGLCTKLNIVGYPPLQHLRNNYASNLEETSNVVKELIRNSMSDDFNKIYIEHFTVEKALKERYTGSVVPVVVLNASNEEINNLKSLFNGSHLVVEVDQNSANKETVIKTFNAVKKQIKETRGN